MFLFFNWDARTVRATLDGNEYIYTSFVFQQHNSSLGAWRQAGASSQSEERRSAREKTATRQERKDPRPISVAFFLLDVCSHLLPKTFVRCKVSERYPSGGIRIS